MGLWAGGLLGLGGEALDNYALSVLRADLKEPGDADVQAKLEADLAGKADAATIRAKLDQLLAESRAEVTKGV